MATTKATGFSVAPRPAPAAQTGFGVATARRPPVQWTDGTALAAQQEVKPVERETTRIARDMLRTVTETTEMGSEALMELDRQGQMIDRAHDNVRRLHGHLDTAEEHITGMKSIFGGLINKLRGKQKALKLDTDIDFPVEWERNKKMQKKTLRFATDSIIRVGDSGVARATIPFADINGVLVLRQGEIEIGHGKTGREFIRAAQYKQIVSLLTRRCPKPIRVVFSDEAAPFDPRSIPVSGAGGAAAAAGFRSSAAPPPSAEALELAGAAEEEFEDRLLDGVSMGLGDLKVQALSMHQELDRQQRKLDMLEVDVDIANTRIRKDNQQMRKLL